MTDSRRLVHETAPTAEHRVRAVTEGLVKVVVPNATWTDEEWRAWADAMVDKTNAVVRTTSVAKDAAANELFRSTYGSDVDAGLDCEFEPSAAYQRLRERDGKSLRLDTGESLQHYVRVGAMNQHRHDAAFINMDFSIKVALLPLLGPTVEVDDDGTERRILQKELMNAGIRMALQPNVGPAAVKAYVRDPTPPARTGRPRGESVTVPRAERFTETGVLLGDPEQRAKFIERFLKAPAPVQRALLKDLRSTMKHIGTLIDEIEDAR